MPKGSRRVTKEEWHKAGGLVNSKCWRRQLKSGQWAYYIMED